ncbi:MAG: hypothetical protein GY737_22130 [Desulfobacteraceae bacterium]|nr:hypothetical protein [Desulfobacteraceae bacterium]
MEIVCNSCQAKLNIPDHKLPKGKKASFNCPKCRERIHILATATPTATGLTGEKPAVSTAYDASDKPFDFVEEDKRTALICMGGEAARTRVSDALEDMGHAVTWAADVEQALTRMKYHLFNVVVVDDRFDIPGNPGVLETLRSLGMASRRRIFVALISERFRTLDNMAAFHQSVNLVVNGKRLDDIKKILVRGVQDHERFYAVFTDSLKATGKA